MQRCNFSGGMYRPLSDEQIRMIHEASLIILEKTGITFEKGLEGTLELLKKAGAEVDTKLSRIKFPRELVMDQVGRAPERVVLYSRDGENNLDLTEDQVYMGTGGAAIKILDIETGQARESTLLDLYLLGRLVDQLDNIHFFLRPCIPLDISPQTYDVNIFYACFRATSKHVMAGVNDEKGFRSALEIASILAGNKEKVIKKPFFSIITSFAISPLKLSTKPTLIMQEACRNYIPVALSSAPAAGSTAPVTMAGTLALLHAEEMAGITICQLTSPEAPLLYGGIPGAADLQSMGYMGGAIECGMMNAAIHQLARHIKVPNYNSSGLTDSKIPDAQAGWEKALSSVLAAMGGSNYVHHAAGMLESMLTVAYEQFVIDDEIIGMCRRVLRGIDVDPEHLALDAIDEVGPGGNFMMSPHTLAHMHKEFFIGNGVSDRNIRKRWEEAGSLDARTRARAIARKLISGNHRSYIPGNVDRVIRDKFSILLEDAVCV
ncbi:MAG: trimethylamine methyltransferase [Spirochaeta sp.]|nr:trimethylamine methyltransferase [Spirochaeta sp.]